jgi:hypothetical protein
VLHLPAGYVASGGRARGYCGGESQLGEDNISGWIYAVPDLGRRKGME